ncbi:hypothetical protein [Wolbachia endosymbiont of Cruorifilaria tuberocauda]|uniref:hypothetical protein n=1 Tax=Wolbachia endosymbiont of Cruorifilaria tuberocauda TaxID=1812111 RepID=UPI00397845B0
MSTAQNALKILKIDVPFAYMAKGHYRNPENERFYMSDKKEFALGSDSKVMLYLQLLVMKLIALL